MRRVRFIKETGLFCAGDVATLTADYAREMVESGRAEYVEAVQIKVNDFRQSVSCS